MHSLLFDKARRVLKRKADAALGRVFSLDRTIDSMTRRPFELHLELTNLCNADCVFCPYQFQRRKIEFMPDEVFYKAVGDYVDSGGGSVGLTPIVGDALIDKNFLQRVQYLRSLPSIDRIWVTTNAILLDRHGIEKVLDSGLTSITISTAGFDREMYKRVYRSKSYRRMFNNVTKLLAANAGRRDPLPITISMRPDRPLDQVMRDPDMLEVMKFEPILDFNWSFTSANGRITESMLSPAMRLRRVNRRPEPCVQLFNGPIVLPSGSVLACSCVAAMDAEKDLKIGDITAEGLLDIWRSRRMAEIREGFVNGRLNATCAGCDMYRNLELYRTTEGRARARINDARRRGLSVKRQEQPRGYFTGG